MGDAPAAGGWLLLCSRSDQTKLILDEDDVTFILPPGCDDVASAIADGDRLFESWADGSTRAAAKLRGWRAAAGAVKGGRLGSREHFAEYVDVCVVGDGLKNAIDAVTGGAESLDALTDGARVFRLEPLHVEVFEGALRAAADPVPIRDLVYRPAWQPTTAADTCSIPGIGVPLDTCGRI